MIRKASESDINEISAIDTMALGGDPSRNDFIRRSVGEGNCYVLTIDDNASAKRIAAYGVLVHTFYDQGMIDMLMVAREHRRKGFGADLMRHMESECRTEKLFTSTNESNTPMQALLTKLGYSPSGVIYNLDPDDPELIYFKQLH
jgi:ribosomal protein S18 acetylase RimI-like enzyme